MKKLLLLFILLMTTSVQANSDWTEYLHNPNYIIGYGFAGHQYPMIKTHPRISFKDGSFSTDAHMTCLEGTRIRTLEKKKICEFMTDEMIFDEEKDRKVATGRRICGRIQRMVLSRPLVAEKQICENRSDIINEWKNNNEGVTYNDGNYPLCTLKRDINRNTTTTFKVFVAEKRNYKNAENYNKRWGGVPVFSQMWTIPECN